MDTESDVWAAGVKLGTESRTPPVQHPAPDGLKQSPHELQWFMLNSDQTIECDGQIQSEFIVTQRQRDFPESVSGQRPE